MNKETKLTLALISAVVLLAFILTISSLNTLSTSITGASETQTYAGYPCVQVVRADGTREDVECGHNLLFNVGKNITRDFLMSGSAAGAVKTIALCNSSAGCASPTAGGAEAYNEYAACGLNPQTGTVSVIASTPGNYTAYYTFTATCDAVKTNVTRIGNSTDYFAGYAFTERTLYTSDTLLINWTLQIL